MDYRQYFGSCRRGKAWNVGGWEESRGRDLREVLVFISKVNKKHPSDSTPPFCLKNCAAESLAKLSSVLLIEWFFQGK